MGETVTNKAPYLQMIGVSKSFHGVHALKNVSFTAERGQVTSLCGENGAGKSTLIKILGGIHKRDAGKIILGGKELENATAAEAISNGISIIHQELNVLDNMSICENIFMGNEVKKGIFVDFDYYHKKSKELLDMVGMNIDCNVLVGKLTTGQKQMVEILRAIATNATVIVMDEPTSSLTSRETENLFRIIDMLKKQDIAVIYISHRMDEIKRLSDKVIVFRDGCYIGEIPKEEITEDKVITMMVGREITDLYAKKDVPIGDVILEAKGLTKDFVRDVSFTLRKGEILGFSGLVGAGRTETMRMIFGIDEPEKGQIFIDGKEVKIKDADQAIGLGIALVPEDRKMQALVLGMTVKENMTLAALKQYKKGLLYDSGKEKALTDEMVDKLRIVTPSIDQKVRNLSGGNQQKVVVAKWMLTKPRILILDEPTRGIDVGAKREIHELICELAGQGVAIIMISSELPEVIGMSDRIIIMHEGRVKGEISAKGATEEQIMTIAVTKGGNK